MLLKDVKRQFCVAGGNMESSGQNLLEQKFEWDLRESFFVINGIFPPKEKALERPRFTSHIKSVPIQRRGKVVGKGRRLGGEGEGGSITLSLYDAVHFVEKARRDILHLH